MFCKYCGKPTDNVECCYDCYMKKNRVSQPPQPQPQSQPVSQVYVNTPQTSPRPVYVPQAPQQQYVQPTVAREPKSLNAFLFVPIIYAIVQIIVRVITMVAYKICVPLVEDFVYNDISMNFQVINNIGANLPVALLVSMLLYFALAKKYGRKLKLMAVPVFAIPIFTNSVVGAVFDIVYSILGESIMPTITKNVAEQMCEYYTGVSIRSIITVVVSTVFSLAFTYIFLKNLEKRILNPTSVRAEVPLKQLNKTPIFAPVSIPVYCFVSIFLPMIISNVLFGGFYDGYEFRIRTIVNSIISAISLLSYPLIFIIFNNNQIKIPFAVSTVPTAIYSLFSSIWGLVGIISTALSIGKDYDDVIEIFSFFSRVSLCCVIVVIILSAVVSYIVTKKIAKEYYQL